MEDTACYEQNKSLYFITTLNTQSSLQIDGEKGIPHGTWTNNQFTPKKPEPPLFINEKVTLNTTAHRKFGQSVKMDREPRADQLTAITDTGV